MLYRFLNSFYSLRCCLISKGRVSCMEMGKIDERKKGPQGGSFSSPWSGGSQVSCGGKSRKIILSRGGWGICLQRRLAGRFLVRSGVRAQGWVAAVTHVLVLVWGLIGAGDWYFCLGICVLAPVSGQQAGEGYWPGAGEGLGWHVLGWGNTEGYSICTSVTLGWLCWKQ